MTRTFPQPLNLEGTISIGVILCTEIHRSLEKNPAVEVALELQLLLLPQSVWDLKGFWHLASQASS